MTYVEPDTEAYLAKIRAIRAKKEAAETAGRASSPTHAENQQQTDDPVKRALRELDLLEVYRRWWPGKPERSAGTDNVNVSCFNSLYHANGDRNPGMSIAVAGPKKGTYYCQACGITGDVLDMWAVKQGEVDANFRRDTRDTHRIVALAGQELLGAESYQVDGKWYSYLPNTPQILHTPEKGMVFADFRVKPDPKAEVGKELPPDGPDLPTTEAAEAETEPDYSISLPWRNFIPANTPLHNYLSIVCADDSPEEYHFFNFLLLLGLLAGKTVSLIDQELVYGNLLVCVVGQTGIGKSRAERHLKRLIAASCPFSMDIPDSTGIKIISGSGSGEYMIREFAVYYPDPRSNGTAPGRRRYPDIPHPGVRGLVRWSELSELVSKSSAKGSTVNQKIMDLYDADGNIEFGSLANSKTIAHNPFGSVTTTTQPESIRSLLRRSDIKSGFLNRWLFVHGTRKPRSVSGVPVNVTPCEFDVKKIIEWRDSRQLRNKKIMEFEQSAYDEYASFIKTVCHPLIATDPLYSRVDLLFKKLVLLMSINLLEDRVSLSAVEQAECILHYALQCYESFGAALVLSDDTECQEAVMAKIEACEAEGITQYKIANDLRRKYTRDEVQSACKYLEQADRIVKKVPTAGSKLRPGRPPGMRYFPAG